MDHLALTVMDFTNVSSLQWKTREKRFLLYVNIAHPIKFDHRKPCYINITGTPAVSSYRSPSWHQHQRYWINYHLASISPLLLNRNDTQKWIFDEFLDEIAQNNPLYRKFMKTNLGIEQPSRYMYMVSNTTTTWNAAETHCQTIKGSQFSLDTYEHFYTLMENVKYVFQQNHYSFWLSSLVFLGKPTLRKVSGLLE